MTTKTAQFTPGPWVAALGERLNTDVYHIDKQGNRVFVAEFATQADAVLGATAPAMYEALSELVKYLREEVADEALDTWAPVFKAAMALAQAEGRQE